MIQIFIYWINEHIITSLIVLYNNILCKKACYKWDNGNILLIC